MGLQHPKWPENDLFLQNFPTKVGPPLPPLDLPMDLPSKTVETVPMHLPDPPSTFLSSIRIDYTPTPPPPFLPSAVRLCQWTCTLVAYNETDCIIFFYFFVTSQPIRLSTNSMTLIPNLTFTELRVVSMERLQRMWHASRERLAFRTPQCSVPFFGNLLMLQLLRPELVVSFLDFWSWIPLGTFSNLIVCFYFFFFYILPFGFSLFFFFFLHFCDITFQLLKLLFLAKDNWWGFNTQYPKCSYGPHYILVFVWSAWILYKSCIVYL